MQWPLIDILKLHYPGDTEKSSIRAFGGKKLNEIFSELFSTLSEKTGMGYRKIAKEIFKVSSVSVQNWKGLNKNYTKGHPIPLFALDKILELLNLKQTGIHRKIVSSIKELQCGRISKNVKVAIYLTPTLAKFCGAHAADGSLYQSKERRSISARWDIGDREEANIIEIRKWTKELFGINLPRMKRGKMFYTWTNMQVISRYLFQIFDFPIGEKSNTVSEPTIFYQDNERILSEFPEKLRWQLRLNFAREVINFDGHSTMTGRVPSVCLGINSNLLRKQVAEIFNHFNINFHNYDKHKKMMTTSRKETQKLFNINIFRGKKREKLKRLLGY